MSRRWSPPSQCQSLSRLSCSDGAGISCPGSGSGGVSVSSPGTIIRVIRDRETCDLSSVKPSSMQWLNIGYSFIRILIHSLLFWHPRQPTVKLLVNHFMKNTFSLDQCFIDLLFRLSEQGIIFLLAQFADILRLFLPGSFRRGVVSVVSDGGGVLRGNIE